MFDKRKPISYINQYVILVVILLTGLSSALAQDSNITLDDFSEKKLKEQKEAEEFRRFHTESPIGEGLYKGETLVYVCSKKHFACVNKESIASCKQNPRMGCIIIEKFKGQKECFKKQYVVMLKTNIDSFCHSKN